MFTEIAGRAWQQAALSQLFVEDTDWSTRFVEACPGGGKTRFSFAAIKYMFTTEQVDTVVVVAPQTMLAIQWAEEAKEHMPDLTVMAVCSDQESGALNAKQFAGQVRGGHKIDVIVVTYAGLAGPLIPEIIDQLARRSRVMGVFDEIHHAGEASSWGRAVMRAFSHASKRLLLSGTPFRGTPVRDENGEIIDFKNADKIPFAEYQVIPGTDKVQIRTDYAYSYKQAIDDDVCRIMSFVRVDGEISWEETSADGVMPHRYRLSEEIEDSLKSKRMDMAFADGSTYSNALVQLSVEKLMEIREKQQDDAALLVVADNINHARRLALYVYEEFGIEAPVVASDDASSRVTIRAFKNDTAPIIISVQMFAEGVDAPRIRVISYLTRKRAPLFWRQVIGRAVRAQSGPGYANVKDQWAYMFFPAIDEMDALAREIEEDIGHIIGPKVVVPPRIPKCPACGHEGHKPRRGAPCPACGYEPDELPPSLLAFINATSERSGAISMGIDIDEETLVMSEKLVTEDPRLRRFSPEQFATLYEVMKANPQYANRFNQGVNNATS